MCMANNRAQLSHLHFFILKENFNVTPIPISQQSVLCFYRECDLCAKPHRTFLQPTLHNLGHPCNDRCWPLEAAVAPPLTQPALYDTWRSQDSASDSGMMAAPCGRHAGYWLCRLRAPVRNVGRSVSTAITGGSESGQSTAGEGAMSPPVTGVKVRLRYKYNQWGTLCGRREYTAGAVPVWAGSQANQS